MKVWKSGLALAGMLALAGCTSSDDDDDTNTTPVFDVAVGTYYTISGNSNVAHGECWGMTFTGPAGTFDDSTAIALTDDQGQIFDFSGSSLGREELWVVNDGAGGEIFDYLFVNADGSELTLGFPNTAGTYHCASYFPTFFDPPNSTYGMLVRVGAAEELINPAFVATGLPTASGNLGTGVGTATNVLEQANDFDLWDFSAGGGNSGLGFVAVIGTGATFKPDLSVYTTSSGNLSNGAGFGFGAAMFKRSTSVTVPFKSFVRSFEPDTTAGFNYRLTLSSAGAPTAATLYEDCAQANAGAAIVLVPGQTVYVQPNVTTLANTHNAAGAQGCTDALIVPAADTGVNSPGRDGVYKLTIPANATVIVGGNGTARDIALLLVTNASCSAEPTHITTCLAAADIYGQDANLVTTDTLRYKNGASVQDVLLIVDDYGDGTTGLGTGTGAYELFIRTEL